MKAQRIETSMQKLTDADYEAIIEAYRAGFVRGDLPGGEQVAVRCRKLLENVRRVALAAAWLRAQS